MTEMIEAMMASRLLKAALVLVAIPILLWAARRAASPPTRELPPRVRLEPHGVPSGVPTREDEADFASLTGLTIDPHGPVLRVTYSSPDQGGTSLLYEYALPPDASQYAVLATGYAHEAHRDSDLVSVRRLPPRVSRDARAWIAEQLSLAQQAGNGELVEALRCFADVLGRAD